MISKHSAFYYLQPPQHAGDEGQKNNRTGRNQIVNHLVFASQKFAT